MLHDNTINIMALFSGPIPSCSILHAAYTVLVQTLKIEEPGHETNISKISHNNYYIIYYE